MRCAGGAADGIAAVALVGATMRSRCLRGLSLRHGGRRRNFPVVMREWLFAEVVFFSP